MEDLHFRSRGSRYSGVALAFPLLALPWSWGTGGALLWGRVWVRSGLDMPCFAIRSPRQPAFPAGGKQYKGNFSWAVQRLRGSRTPDFS